MKKTADWRAVCGKTARTVRREGRAKPVPTPIKDFVICNTEKIDVRAKSYPVWVLALSANT
uniref:Uncharacterized protein n=2 Tax=Candidatus Kentrum sp. LPFa TaxID=2126335 RepID=A0A450Y085_9GAMM|nr:MAG: hypothetical protein BECKLPF1236C_GA0070990_103131 [Candidatus Kentron sp. LPFa]